MPLLIGFGIIVVLVGAAWYWRARQLDQRSLTNAQELVVLKVLVPKELDAHEKEDNRSRDFREAMSVAEQFFASFSSLYEKALEHQLFGQETISLELVVKDTLISFFIAAPKHLQEVVERTLHSYYPDAHVEPSQEFRMFGDPVYVAGMYMETDKPDQFPVRTYKALESDPLNAITNSFSKLPEGMKAGLQILIRPTSGNWRGKT